MPILEIVNDCSVKNARWDYSIKVSTKQTFLNILTFLQAKFIVLLQL